MNKQEAIKTIEKLGEYEHFVDEPISKKSVLNIISKIDEPQKVTIPKFVAEWIKQNRHKTLFSALGGADWNNSPWIDWVKEIGDTATPQEIFARAWLDGYEVEKEKLYTVEIPDPNGTYTHRFLKRKSDGSVFIEGSHHEEWRNWKSCQLTEAEIKQDFDWAWQWAKPVEVE